MLRLLSLQRVALKLCRLFGSARIKAVLEMFLFQNSEPPCTSKKSWFPGCAGNLNILRWLTCHTLTDGPLSGSSPPRASSGLCALRFIRVFTFRITAIDTVADNCHACCFGLYQFADSLIRWWHAEVSISERWVMDLVLINNWVHWGCRCRKAIIKKKTSDSRGQYLDIQQFPLSKKIYRAHIKSHHIRGVNSAILSINWYPKIKFQYSIPIFKIKPYTPSS